MKGLAEFFKRYAHSSSTQSNFIEMGQSQIFLEVSDCLWDSLFKNRHRGASIVRLTKEIPASHALFILGHFYGLNVMEYGLPSLAELTGQIELQLFKSGMMKMPSKEV
jgi:hypothetical protein